MSYKKISITIGLLLGTLVSAQPTTQQDELAPNSIIAYFDENGTLLPNRELSTYYRYFKDIVSGCYLVQDFYTINDQKQTDPICFTDPAELQSWFPQSMQGPITFWSIDGQKMQEGYSQQDGGTSGFWTTWDQYGNSNTYELINDELIISYFDQDGNTQPSPVPGGTFRTLLEQYPENNEYIVADYFTDSRTRQMDPVAITEDDLFRWNIESRRGTYAYYNTEGDLLTLEEYNSNGLLDGSITNWYDGAYPPQKFETITFNDGQQEGLYVRWYINGNPKIKLIIEDNAINALECWDENFQALPQDNCIALLDEPQNAHVDTAPIEIMIPEENVDDATETLEEEADIPSVEVIMPAEDLDDTTDSNYTDEFEGSENDQNIDEINNEVDLNYDEQLEEIEEIEAQYDEPEAPEQTEGQKILNSIKGILNAL